MSAPAVTPGPDTELTMEMVRAGIDAYRQWEPEQEEVAALVAAIFVAMVKAREPRLTPEASQSLSE